VLPQFVLR